MQDAFAHCERLVRSEDRDRFLATLFAPAAQRPALFALYAFDLEVVRISRVVKQPLAGEIRLQWWRDVLDGLRNEEAAANPVAVALLTTVERYQFAPSQLTGFVEVHSVELYDEPVSLDQFENYAIGAQAQLLRLVARVLSLSPMPDVGLLARHAGLATALLQWLRNGRASRLPLPPDELSLLACRELDAAAPLLGAVPPEVLPALLPVALVRPTLDRMRRNSPDISPWRRQWILWRAARDPRRIFQ